VLSEAEYEAALARVHGLMGAPLGSPEGDELERLCLAVEEYEHTHYPVQPPTEEAAAEFRREQEDSDA
jgi:HTH-type transcriptional regulator/antitoxin HigA